MLCRRPLITLIRQGTASKFTFVHGRGITPKELQIMKLEALGVYNPKLPDLPEQRYIPLECKGHQNFFYDTELFAFANRIGATNISKVTELLNIALAHETFDSKSVILARNTLNNQGIKELMDYIYAYHQNIYPNLTSSILHKLTEPLKCLTISAYFKMVKTLCLQELIRVCLSKKEMEKLDFKMYWYAMGGIYMSLKYGESPAAAKQFIDTFILNIYSQLDLRTVITFDNPKLFLTELLKEKNMYPPVERITNEVGIGTELPTHIVGIFSGDDLLAQGADYKLEEAIDEAWMASIRSYLMERDFNSLPVYVTPVKDTDEMWLEDLMKLPGLPDERVLELEEKNV